MPTNNVVNGTMAVIKTGANHATATAIGLSTNASLSFTMETRDISNKSSGGWRELLEAQRSWSVSCEGLYAFLDSAGAAVKNYDDFWVLMNNRTPVYIEIATGVTGDKYYAGSCYITSLEQSAPMEDNMTYSMSFEGTGILIEATQ